MSALRVDFTSPYDGPLEEVKIKTAWSQDLGMFWSQDLELVELVWMVCPYLRCEERISTAINWKSIFNKYEVWNTNITICTKQNSLP